MKKLDSSGIPWCEPWKPLPVELEEKIVAELRREMPLGHILFNRAVQPFGHRPGSDDYVFYVADAEPRFAVVHLTYARETNPEWPATELYDSLKAWINQCMIPDAENSD